jgi:hypothetical protein
VNLFTDDGAGDIAIGLVGGDEDLVVVVHAELFEVEQDMMSVWHL